MLKINSNFQDYYDSAIGSFAESEVVINRKTKELNKRDLQPVIPADIVKRGYPEFDYVWNMHKDRTFSTCAIGAIGFCGRWYYFIWDEGKIRYVTFDMIVENHATTTFWSFVTRRRESVKLVDLNTIPFFQSEIFEKYGPVLYFPSIKFQYLDNSSIRYEGQQMDLVVFPELKSMNFQTQKDPFSALWELEHWYDTHARPDDAKVPVGDDLTRLKSAGFDAKTSFRKPKEKK